jgi:hypothetical protein
LIDEALHAVRAEARVGEQGGDVVVPEREPLVEGRIEVDRAVLLVAGEVGERVVQATAAP